MKAAIIIKLIPMMRKTDELWYNSGKDYHREESLNGTEFLCDICHRKVSFTKESTFSKSVSQSASPSVTDYFVSECLIESTQLQE